MHYRLLVAVEIVEAIQSLPKRSRIRLLDHFNKIRSTPEGLSDYHEHDLVGRRVEISIFAGHAIHYWIDHADRHIKILALKSAD